MKTDVNGITLAYDQQGSGKPVVFIHGYPLNRKMWQPQISDLSSHANVTALDLRGHGESSASDADFSMDLFAEDLAGFIQSAGDSQPVILCGLSMGGYVAFAFYHQFPHLVSGLVLAATRAGADSPEGRTNRDKAIQTVQSQGSEAIFQGMLSKLLAPANYAEMPILVETAHSIMKNSVDEASIVKDLKALRDRQDATPLLTQISVSTLIVHGAEDQIIPLSEAQLMQAAIPGARLVVLQNAGHLVNLEQPTKFNEAFVNFLGLLA